MTAIIGNQQAFGAWLLARMRVRKRCQAPYVMSELTINAANERKPTLESEVLPVPEIDAARVRALEELDAASRLAATLREQVSMLAAELAADRTH